MILAERRHSNSSRMVGIVGTGVAIAAVGFLLVNMKTEIITLEKPKDMIMILPETPPEPPKVEKVAPKEDTKPIETPVVQMEVPEIIIDTPPVENAPPVALVEAPVVAPPAIEPAPAAVGPPATRPKLNAGAKPEYPPAALRAQESGTTTLNLCVSKAGSVTSASISGSSGSQTLDNAALTWIKRERFKPATENGQPIDVCDSQLSYVWQLPAR
jgi:protein TonB